MSSISSLPFTVGKFLITPLTRTDVAGRFIASLSIRRGQGTQTNDRVYTFKPEFNWLTTSGGRPAGPDIQKVTIKSRLPAPSSDKAGTEGA